MTAIYAVYDRDGLVGRCDARCHEAKQPECKCICGGAHHGVGAHITREEADTVTDDEILENARKIGVTGTPWVYRYGPQLELFTG